MTTPTQPHKDWTDKGGHVRHPLPKALTALKSVGLKCS